MVELLDGTIPLVVPVVQDGQAVTKVLVQVDHEDGWYEAMLYASDAKKVVLTAKGLSPHGPVQAVHEALRRLRFTGAQATGSQLVLRVVT